MNVNFQTQRAHSTKQNTSFGMKLPIDAAESLSRHFKPGFLKDCAKFGNDNLIVKGWRSREGVAHWYIHFAGEHLKKFEDFTRSSIGFFDESSRHLDTNAKSIGGLMQLCENHLNNQLTKIAKKGQLKEFIPAFREDHPAFVDMAQKIIEERSLQTLDDIAVRTITENPPAPKAETVVKPLQAPKKRTLWQKLFGVNPYKNVD